MLETFENALEKTMKSENIFTENGAIGYKTSGKALVDFNFKMSSYRDMNEAYIIHDFNEVYNENPIIAVKMLFFTGDIREGMGERRVFNTCLNWLASTHPEVIKAVLPYIPEYNRWDAVIELCFNPNTQKEAVNLIAKQLIEDEENMKLNKSISLLAKWMPSINTSSKKTVLKGKRMISLLQQRESDYRKMLSAFRKYLDVVEVKMSSNNWHNIKYENIPSKANLLYKDAFMKHDAERRSKYLEALKNGETKINSSVAFPCDIISKYRTTSSNFPVEDDDTYEEMWKSLPNYVGENGADTICVVDGSGSMTSNIGNSRMTCLDVAHSLGIYFAEKMQGAFHNKFITFSCNPQLVKFEKDWSLRDKLIECDLHDEVSNTDIEKVFDLILNTAIQNNLSQDELPKNVLILSDMEFDACSIRVSSSVWNMQGKFMTRFKTLFESIRERYEEHGYKLPKLVFWNICSRSKAIPLQENEAGVVLISGFSPTIASMVFSSKLEPYQVILERLASPRYDVIEKALKTQI